jgi:hypothetical protein
VKLLTFAKGRKLTKVWYTSVYRPAGEMCVADDCTVEEIIENLSPQDWFRELSGTVEGNCWRWDGENAPLDNRGNTYTQIVVWRRDKNHGGAGRGAGAKPLRGEAKVATSSRVTPEVKEYLDQCEPSGSEAIEEAIRRSKGFRDWKKLQG